MSLRVCAWMRHNIILASRRQCLSESESESSSTSSVIQGLMSDHLVLFMEISSVLSDESKSNWIEVQELLKRRLVLDDGFSWSLSTNTDGEKLRYVGGVDLSFSKDDSSIACGALVVVDLNNGLNVVYEDFRIVHLQIPYVPGFLAFREAPVLLELLEKMKHDDNPYYPQCLMVDGNGLLHPRGFGLACHLGVTANLPTIGIGKNLHHVDGLIHSEVRKVLEAKEDCAEDVINLTGNSGRIWGAAMRSTQGSLKPIYISTGHRMSLETAIKVVKMVCKHRVPEPIRQADIRSRYFLEKNRGVINKECN